MGRLARRDSPDANEARLTWFMGGERGVGFSNDPLQSGEIQFNLKCEQICFRT
jgi:hypothetical protein